MAAAVGLAVAGLVPSAVAQRRVEVYRMKYRTAEEMAPIVETILAGSGSVAVDRGTNSLVLIGDPKSVSEVLGLLETQDRKLRSVVLRYDTRRVRDLEARGFSVRWTAQAGDLRIGNLARPTGSGSSVAVRLDDETRRLAESFAGTLRVTEGERARIETGTTVPFTTRSRFGPNTEFVTASTGFEASARIQADGSVQVDLASFAGQLARGGRIEKTNASTLVSVKPGETILVGGLDRSTNEERDRLTTGSVSSSTRDDTVLLLRADIE